MHYLKAENLKHKHTFTRTLIFLAPFVTVLMTCLSPVWFQVNAFNWWYVFLYPGFLTLLCVMIEQKDSGKKKYQTIFTLPVQLSRIWLAKIETAGLYALFGNLIFFTLNVLGGFILRQFLGQDMTIGVSNALLGTALIVLVGLWEIPFCLYLTKKTGLALSLMINVGIGSILGILLASHSYWFLCPYSWVPRLMIYILHIMPNGTLVQVATIENVPVVVGLTLALSILLFIILSIVTANQFSKQEAK